MRHRITSPAPTAAVQLWCEARVRGDGVKLLSAHGYVVPVVSVAVALASVAVDAAIYLLPFAVVRVPLRCAGTSSRA